MASISTRRALNSASKSPFEPLRRSAKSLSAAVLIWHCTICCPFLIVNLNAIRSASYPMAFPVLSGMNPVPFPTTREADHAVGCQVSIYRARQLTFWKQRSKACPQRFASSRPAGIAGDVTDPVLQQVNGSFGYRHGQRWICAGVSATSRNRIDGNVPGASWPAKCRWGGMTSPVSHALKREEITRVRESL
jgi:hypothetical protein